MEAGSTVVGSRNPLRRLAYNLVMSPPLLPLRTLLVNAYYRFIFGHRVPGLSSINKIVRAFEVCRGAGDIPNVAKIWESQYQGGYWDFLKGVDQVPHNSVIAGYFRFMKPGGIVLDVGCGEGVLSNRLGRDAYSKYVGIDCSEAAISIASKNENENTLFIAADATRYVPVESFDAIIFNESLYYFEDPLAVFDHYTHVLKGNGILLTSVFMTARTSAILRSLKRRYPLLDEVSVTNQKRHMWVCSVFRGHHTH